MYTVTDIRLFIIFMLLVNLMFMILGMKMDE